MARKKETIIECCECGSSKIYTEFYSSNSSLFKETGVYPVCKKCIQKIYEDLYSNYRDSKTSLMHLCISMNIPFDEKTANKLLDKDNPVSGVDDYIYSITKNQPRKGYKIADEDNITRIKDFIEKFGLEDEDVDFKVTKDMIARWGKNYDVKDIMFLENIYNGLLESYGGTQLTARSLYCDYAQNELHKQQALSAGRDDVYIKYQTAQSKLMADARLKPAQEEKTNDDDYLVGLFIKNVEKYQPIPEADESFKDIDNIQKIISNEYIRTLKRSIGGALK